MRVFSTIFEKLSSFLQRTEEVVLRHVGFCVERTIEFCLLAYVRLIKWSPIGRSVSIRVVEGEKENFNVIVTGIIIHVDGNNIVVQLTKPWHYINRTTSVSNFVLIPTQPGIDTANRLLLGNWHKDVFSVPDANSNSSDDVIARCIVHLVKNSR